MQKKVLSVIIATAMITTLLTACGSENTTSIPQSNNNSSVTPYNTSNNVETETISSTEPTFTDRYDEVMNIINHATLQYPSSNDEFEYNVYDTYVEIVRYIGNDSNIVFPSTIDNLPVLIIGSKGRSLLPNQHTDSITIEEGIAIIGDNVFFGYRLPKNFKLPNSILEIRDDAFGYADVPNIEFPSNLRKIGDYAFKGATGNDWDIVIPEKVESIGRSCFDDFTSGSFKSIKFLNPNTKIVNVSENSLNRHTVIYGYAGSTAAKYASEKGNEFKLITD